MFSTIEVPALNDYMYHSNEDLILWPSTEELLFAVGESSTVMEELLFAVDDTQASKNVTTGCGVKQNGGCEVRQNKRKEIGFKEMECKYMANMGLKSGSAIGQHYDVLEQEVSEMRNKKEIKADELDFETVESNLCKLMSQPGDKLTERSVFQFSGFEQQVEDVISGGFESGKELTDDGRSSTGGVPELIISPAMSTLSEDHIVGKKIDGMAYLLLKNKKETLSESSVKSIRPKMDDVLSKQSESEPVRRIYFGSIPYTASCNDLSRCIYNQTGFIPSGIEMSKRNKANMANPTASNGGIAFVQMSTLAQANTVIAAFDNKINMGRKMYAHFDERDGRSGNTQKDERSVNTRMGGRSVNTRRDGRSVNTRMDERSVNIQRDGLSVNMHKPQCRRLNGQRIYAKRQMGGLGARNGLVGRNTISRKRSYVCGRFRRY